MQEQQELIEQIKKREKEEEIQKEIESFEIDKYYTNILLNNIKTHQQLWFTLHFYENIIFGLIKRRENKKKFI